MGLSRTRSASVCTALLDEATDPAADSVPDEPGSSGPHLATLSPLHEEDAPVAEPWHPSQPPSPVDLQGAGPSPHKRERSPSLSPRASRHRKRGLPGHWSRPRLFSSSSSLSASSLASPRPSLQKGRPSGRPSLRLEVRHLGEMLAITHGAQPHRPSASPPRPSSPQPRPPAQTPPPPPAGVSPTCQQLSIPAPASGPLPDTAPEWKPLPSTSRDPLPTSDPPRLQFPPCSPSPLPGEESPQ